jgi:hypothetical protein
MSIIYEALKKVGDSGSANPLSGKEKNKKTPIKPYLLYILVVVSGLFIANLLFSLFTARPPGALQAQIAPPQKKLSAASIPAPANLTAQVIEKEASPAWALNGVFFSQDSGFALINNQIVKEGDTVLGATVVRITRDLVELKFKDSEIKLYSPQ